MTESSPSACIDLYLGALCDADRATFCEAWHSDGLRLGLTVDGAVSKQNVDQVWESNERPNGGRLLSMTTISETCACAKIKIIEPSKVITQFVTLLKDKHDAWKIIAIAHSSVAAGAVHRKIIPCDFSQVADAVWRGYVTAGRACDAVAMGKVFHPVSNLSYVDDNGNLAVISSDDFCGNVARRWSNELHKPYAHLQNDSRIAAADTLLSIEFASPDVAMVSLNIGYPPFLYTDVLLLLRLSQSIPERADSKAGWWIVAKSSDNTPWMTDESKPAL